MDQEGRSQSQGPQLTTILYSSMLRPGEPLFIISGSPLLFPAITGGRRINEPTERSECCTPAVFRVRSLTFSLIFRFYIDDNDLNEENSIRRENSAFWKLAHCSGPRSPRCASSSPQRAQLSQSSFANFGRLSQTPAQQRTQSATTEETEESPQNQSPATLAASPADAPKDKP